MSNQMPPMIQVSDERSAEQTAASGWAASPAALDAVASSLEAKLGNKTASSWECHYNEWGNNIYLTQGRNAIIIAWDISEGQPSNVCVYIITAPSNDDKKPVITSVIDSGSNRPVSFNINSAYSIGVHYNHWSITNILYL